MGDSVLLTNFWLNHRQPPAKRHQDQDAEHQALLRPHALLEGRDLQAGSSSWKGALRECDQHEPASTKRVWQSNSRTDANPGSRWQDLRSDWGHCKVLWQALRALPKRRRLGRGQD